MNDDFRVYVYTCHRLGISSQEIHIELVTVRGDASPSSRTVSRWISNIRTDQFRLENRAGCGRPLSTTSTAKVKKIKTLITENCRLSCSDIEYILSIPKSCVHEVLTKHLHLGNVYAVWVPHNLSTSNKTARVNCCQKLIKLFNVKGFQYLCSNYLVQDESCFWWDKTEDIRVHGYREEGNEADKCQIQAHKTEVNGFSRIYLKTNEVLCFCAIMWYDN